MKTRPVLHQAQSGAPASGQLHALSSLLAGGPAAVGEAEWESLTQVAVRHGVGAALYVACRGTEGLSEAVLGPLQAHYAWCALRGQAQAGEVGALARAFAGAGIPVLALKGIHLAASVYPAPTLRVMGDLDLLVAPDDLARAEALLTELGYTSRRYTSIERHCEGSHHLGAFRKPSATPVEIHWTLETPPHPFRIDLERLWERAQVIEVGRERVPTLSSEDLLLHLCLHLCFHHGCMLPLRNVYDIALLTRRFGDALDWDYVVGAARTWGITRPVGCALALARHFFPGSVPGADLPGLSLTEAETRWFVARAEALVAGYDAPLNWRVLAAERLSRSVARRFLWHLFPPVTTVRGLLPPGAGRLDLLGFYLARPARLLGKYHRALAGVLLRRPAAVGALGTLRLRGQVERWMTSEPG